jgi:uncharacterized C2H2 Zn-finger protein
MLTIHGLHHQRVDKQLLHVHRKKRGGGLMQIDKDYVAKINKFIGYMEGRKDPLMQNLRTHQQNTNSESLQSKISRNIFEIKSRE